MLGLSYQVSMDRLSTAERICAKLDPGAVRLLQPNAEEMKTRYGGEYGEIGRFEIVWSHRPSMSVRFLQLMEPFWYYSLDNQPQSLDEVELVGIGISSFEGLLSEYHLTSPTHCLGER